MKRIVICLFLALGVWALPPAAVAAVYVSINIAPPPLPYYIQPAPPAADLLWIPGYWAYDDDGYYWVPGTWVLAPQRGFLWTPGYWAWGGGLYYWHGGYWGPTVGYYGGVYYGYGYYGSGYYGGRWEGDHFYYNRNANNVNVTHIHNTYNETINNNVTVNRVSYNGGQGGTAARPSERERNAERERIEATPEQVRHEQGARGNRELRMSANKGRPPIAATPRPGAFNDGNAQPAHDDAQERPGRRQGKSAPDKPAREARKPAGQEKNSGPTSKSPDPPPGESGKNEKRRKGNDKDQDKREASPDEKR